MNHIIEGDVEGIMERPSGNDEPSRRAKEKWEAWHAHSGLSRTEAKRRYITTLIDTMNKYASGSPESRELVSELEFVWDQVKSNVPSSNSSSPLQSAGIQLNVTRQAEPPRYGAFGPAIDHKRESPHPISERDMHFVDTVAKEKLNIEATGDAEDEEEFVDAPDSQVDEPIPTNNISAVISSPSRGIDLDRDAPMSGERHRKRRGHPYLPAPPPSSDENWKKNVSASIIKLTAELAAVREQLEARRLFTHTIQFRILRFLTKFIWGIVKHIAIDVFILVVLITWLRGKGDKRLEGAMRVLLGDAVAQVQKLGDVQLGKLHISKLGISGKKLAD
ncbi:hypothetical protein, variant 1 [Verruconis gallopava]|uniref:ACB domain-containing protein n=1 Tax=Verruconis gallopava TaxID=253628 RepID=A0A0D1YCM4_9PEZI|nr:hypothetical protein, variant 1 [Verruconis gallopava]KIV98431.1 hypothetical protein, variant 1 [Verruconis gallopava]